MFYERTKHIEIDCHFIRHHLLQGTLTLQSVSSQDQLADIFTKLLPPETFRALAFKLRMVSLKPPWGMLDYYIVRFILYFPRIVICIFLGLYSLAYIRPPLVLVIYSL